MTILMTDLFRFVNEGWLATHAIPDDRPIDGTFYQLSEQAELDVYEIVKNSPDSRAGKLFHSFMDTEAIEAAGIAPLDPDLQLIDAVTEPGHNKADVDAVPDEVLVGRRNDS